MRPNNPNKRLRGRNRSKNSNPLARSYESNGPDVKIRGSALQIADKYSQLARDAQSSGDRVMAENYFQHAEHYYRIVAQAYEQSNSQQPRERREDGGRNGRYDDRFGGEQPSINGFDGLDDEDEGVRRTIRANGDDRDDDGDSDGDNDGDDEIAVHTHHNGSNGNAAKAEPEAEVEMNGSDEGGHAEANADAPSEDEAKPKRRTRAPRARTRTRRTESADQAPAGEPAEQAS
ncbi:DUF4167 domain-containing protein [Acuticoccus kandeliae]|uniref:DUF4167 domain-containing protein n=1 Tax=Acuticoccus kandeliae TaxID=2073160 RepID=UPI000D3EDFF9|nr:DUF4167 domain-containing protein [Acuticoccus kandeliae]